MEIVIANSCCGRRPVILLCTAGLIAMATDVDAAADFGALLQQVSEAPAAGREIEQGVAHLRQGRPADAIAAFKRALALDPASGYAHQLLGEAYLQQGTYDMLGEARAELQQAIALDSRLVWARFHLARLYLDFGEARKAHEQLLAAVEQRPDVPHLQSLLGEAKRQLSQPRESIERQERALRIDPAFAPARYYLGLALLDVKEDEAALAALEAAASSKLPIPELYLTLGSVHDRAGRMDRARRLFERAVEIAPHRPEGHLRLASARRRQGDAAGALEELSRALPSGQRLLTTEYYQQLEADVLLERGRALQDLRRWDEAARAYADAVAVQPDRGEAHRYLAEALYQQGEYRRALEHARRAAALAHPLPPELLARITERGDR
jgi:tetratricopeptide (TPR) repeat protein